ncbi:MAG: hypothetical protein U5Q03_14885 [Bacteroidota bacterium]|nr:hypothetical protein [Bacteroidota bacterium]
MPAATAYTSTATRQSLVSGNLVGLPGTARQSLLEGNDVTVTGNRVQGASDGTSDTYDNISIAGDDNFVSGNWLRAATGDTRYWRRRLRQLQHRGRQ